MCTNETTCFIAPTRVCILGVLSVTTCHHCDDTAPEALFSFTLKVIVRGDLVSTQHAQGDAITSKQAAVA